MIRYVKQRDRHSCGPTAVLNAMKWSGAKDSYAKDIKKLSWLCRRYSKAGTGHAQLDLALRYVGGLRRCDFSVLSVIRPTLAQIESHLLGEGSVVLSYLWKNKYKSGRHVSLITNLSPCKKSFRVVNSYRKGPASYWITRTEMRGFHLRFQRTDPHCRGWFLTKGGT